MFNRKKRGQSTIEYLLLVTAVIVVLLTFFFGPTASFNKKLGTTLNAASDQMNQMGARLNAFIPDSIPGNATTP